MKTRFDMMLPRRQTILGGVALAAGAGAAAPAAAQLTIDMTKPSFEPVPIAIVDFKGDRVGADIAGVVRNDLQNSGLFRSIAPSAFIQRDPDPNAPPRLQARAPVRRAISGSKPSWPFRRPTGSISSAISAISMAGLTKTAPLSVLVSS